jgi:cell division protein FtsQ
MTSALAALPRAVRRAGVPRVPLRPLLALTVILALGIPSWLWFRDSSLVRVRDVFITGVQTGDSNRIRAALKSAAADMTTLNVREDALRTAVAAYPSVARLEVDADFPHKLTIVVVEHVPVAAIEIDGRPVPVAGSGLVLRGARGGDALPLVKLERAGTGEKVTEGSALASLTLLAAAPPELRPRLDRAFHDKRGLVVATRQGPELVFGTPERARAKWVAAARVLADPTAAGAVYLDLRIPERVAAGGVGPTTAEEPSVEAAATAAPIATATPIPTVTAVPTATPVPTVPTPVPESQP